MIQFGEKRPISLVKWSHGLSAIQKLAQRLKSPIRRSDPKTAFEEVSRIGNDKSASVRRSASQYTCSSDALPFEAAKRIAIRGAD